MNEEQRKWRDQYTHNLGAKEFFRLAIGIVVWILAGVALSIITRSSIVFDVFFIVLFVFPFIVTKWRPVYLVFRKLVGNVNLPAEPYPHSKVTDSSVGLPWWSFLPSIWWLLVDLLLLLAVLGYLSSR